jgi:hypothetical protein
LLIILGGIYLIARNMMNWRIPVAVLGTVFVLSGASYLINPVAYPSPIFMFFSGGLMLGAVFMATDMVASPLTPLGIVDIWSCYRNTRRGHPAMGRTTGRGDVCHFIGQCPVAAYR